LIEENNPNISPSRQAFLLDISRSSLSYEPRVNERDITAMHALDEIYTRSPFYGSRRMRVELEHEYHLSLCRDHIRRLMRVMGLQAVYPRKNPNTSLGNREHVKFPYLLKNIVITHPDQVWGTDITYIRLKNGFAYLSALLDWFSRYVVSWKLSPSLETRFCTDTLNDALEKGKPEMHNSDQGVQYTSEEYVGTLRENDIAISMDGRGRCMDNIFTERLWRTVKYEDVYLHEYGTIEEARSGLSEYFPFYNERRRHQSLEYRTPAEVYFSKRK
jgi:putative transposase